MLRAPLIGHEVVQMCDSSQKRLLAVGPENPNQLKCLTFVPVMITLAQPIFP